MKNFLLYIIEDDKELCQKYLDEVKRYPNLQILGLSHNTSQALSEVKKLKPDIIILDLEFQNTSGNGLAFLKQLSNIRNFQKPYIIVSTNNISVPTQKIARNLGADFFISKQQADFSPSLPFAYINSFSDALYEALFPDSTPDIKEYTDDDRLEVIRQELLTLTMNPKYKGFHYIESAILLSLTTTVKNKSEICDILARKHKKSKVNIEQSMQNAINKCWGGNLEYIQRIYTAPYSSDNDRPTTKEFLEFYINKLKSCDCFRNQNIL